MNLQGIKKRIAKILVYTITSTIFLLIYLFLVLQIPAVQKILTQQFLSNFSEVVGFTSSVKSIRLSWFDRLVLEDILILDSEQNEMIGVKRLIINYKLTDLIQGNHVNMDAVNIDNARVFLTPISETDTSKNLNINVFINEINKHYASSGGGGKSPKINIGEAILTNSYFKYDYTGTDSLSGFDYNHFAVDIDEAQLQHFIILGDTIEFKVNSLTAVEAKTKFPISQLSTFFRISQKGMEFRGINLHAGKSVVSDTILFTYDSQSDLSDFVNKVKINARLRNTTLYPEDLLLFAPIGDYLQTHFTISGDFRGTINNFRLNDMAIQAGNTVLQGSLSMDGLPDFNETFIVLNLKNSKVHFNLLSGILNETVMQRLKALGTLSVNAEFLGYPTDFVAKGNFSNQLGRIISDINLKLNEQSIERSLYRGEIKMIDFHLGKYFNDTTVFQRVNMNGRITGSGFSGQTANFKLISTIQSIGIKGYNYTNISTNGTFASQFFNGDISVNDPNIKIQATGTVDLRNKLNALNVNANIDTINFQKINLTKDNFVLQGNVNINTKGFVLDSLTGNAHIQDLTLQYKDQFLHQDNIILNAQRDPYQRSLTLQSDIVDIKTEGDFYFSKLFRDIPVLINELYQNIKNDKEAINQYYGAKEKVNDEYEATFLIKLKSIKPVADLLNVDFGIGKNISIDGKFSTGKTTVMQAFTTIDSLRYQNINLYNTELEINASKYAESTESLVMAYMNSQTQNIGGLETKDFSMEAIWNKHHIDFTFDLLQQQLNNSIHLAGIVELLDSTEIKLQDNSKIQLLEKLWSVHRDNKITVKGSEWHIHKFEWLNENQSVGLHGNISNDPEKILSLKINEFNLATINSISQKSLDGILNAEIHATNLYREFTIQNLITINELKVNNFLVGNVTGNNLWNTGQKKFLIEFLIDRMGDKIINCSGYYDPSETRNPLFITAHLEKANLKILEPFIDEILSDFGGTISGTYTITGTLNAPAIQGKGKLDNGQLKVNYLNTTYQVSGNVGLRPNAIYFENIELTDALNNKGKLQGEISHVNFRQMKINIGAKFEKLHLLNTSAKDNSLFYGQGYATGDVVFEGPIDNLKITANAITNKNTRVSIPLSGSSSTEKKDFINFVNFTDSTYQTTVQTTAKKIRLTGVTFDFNLEVTPDAYCEIIFDIKAGDIIHGRGNGKIKLQLDTKGEFNMFGPVVFTEGGYNFTLYDIINKEFKIEPGSSITWYGDPYQGAMKINATYNQLASLSPILQVDPTQLSSPQIRRKYQVQVLLKMDGPMLSPQIDFDIIGKDLPKSVTLQDGTTYRLEDQFQVFKNKLDEQELKRQVFSLIVLRKFSPPESFNTSGSLVSSVSELFSNQLSYWMSQVDENLTVDLDLGTMDQESFNAFQLRLSYSFMNGRLRITRDGTIGNQASSSTTTTENGQSFSSVVGDWTVDYLLTPDGKFKVKMYSRSNVSSINNSINAQNTYTTGVSLSYTQSFNELKDLFTRTREKNLRKPEDEVDTEEQEENNNNEPEK